MKKLLTVSLLIVINYLATYSQDQLKPNNYLIYNFGNRIAERTYDTIVKLNNTNNFAITINDYKFLSGYGFDDFSSNLELPVSLPPQSSLDIKVFFHSSHNISRSGILVLHCSTASGTDAFYIPIFLTARSEYAEAAYSSTYDKWGSALVSDLRNYVSGHTSFSYNQARTYMFSDCDNIDGYVECIYTGRKIKTNSIPATDFDTEHLWPQSLGAKNEPQRSDLNHLRPTYQKANNARSSFPFGIVVRMNDGDFSDNGSKLGFDKSDNRIFEPRDISKGNVARGLLYFGLRYSNPTNFINSMETMLHGWNLVDRPDSLERRRNDRVEHYQKRRNPFVDHPEFAERLSISDNNYKKPQYLVVDRDTILFKTNGDQIVSLINSDADPSIISDAINSSVFTATLECSDFNTQKMCAIRVSASCTADTATGRISISGNNGTASKIVYLVYDNRNTSALDDEPIELVSVSPIPTSDEITIRIAPHYSVGNILLFAINGELVADLTGSANSANEIRTSKSALNIPAGVYFLQCRIGNKTVRKAILVG